MTWIDLGTPKPRTENLPYSPYVWETLDVLLLPTPQPFNIVPFAATVLGRRTRRTFKALSDVQISGFFWLTSHCTSLRGQSPSPPESLHPTPSAGSIHPIHVIVGRFDESGWWRYEPSDHSLVEINIPPFAFDDLRSAMGEVVPFGEATALVLVAEPGKTFAKYELGSSLVWRDAGVLIGYQSLVAEALGLSYCPLGITADSWVSRLDPERKLVGVGAALLGAP